MAEAAEQVKAIEDVDEVDVVTGPYDVIAHIVADEIDAIGKLVVTDVQTVKAVIRTLTCPVVRL